MNAASTVLTASWLVPKTRPSCLAQVASHAKDAAPLIKTRGTRTRGVRSRVLPAEGGVVFAVLPELYTMA